MLTEEEFEEDDELEQIICSQCGCELDDEVLICPVCQKSLRPALRLNPYFLVALVLTLVVILLWPHLWWLFLPK
jgi:uncharacterized paraquat-inducible protein A